MNEKLTSQQRRKGYKLGGAAVALGLLVGGAAGYAAGDYAAGKPDGKSPVEVNLADGVEKYTEAMEAALNRGEAFTGATIMLHNEFVINEDAQEKTWH